MRKLLLGSAFALVFFLSTVAQAATEAEAAAFVAQAEKELSALSLSTERANWINATYLTDDTDALAAEFGARSTQLSVRLAKEAAKFNDVKGFDVRRKLDFLKQGIVLPASQKP